MLSVLLKQNSIVRNLQFDKTELSIGRVVGNDIILPSERVSKRHAKIILNIGKVILFDLNSTNGIAINNEVVRGSRIIHPDDRLIICGFLIQVKFISGKTAVNTDPHMDKMLDIPDDRIINPTKPATAQAYAIAQTATKISQSGIEIRNLLLKMFKTCSEFDAFCVDQFPSLYQKMSPAMDRDQKANMILLDAWINGIDMAQLLLSEYTELYHKNTQGSAELRGIDSNQRIGHG